MATIEDYFEERVKLPTPPAIALKILEAVRSDSGSLDDVARIVMADPALTARVLKVANSSLYSLRVPVCSVAQASVLIGGEAIRNIALAFVIVEAYGGTPEASFDIDLFWRRSITAAVAAEQLTAQTGLKDRDIFISAMLQDLGVLIMFLSDPVPYSLMLDEKRISGASLCEAEQGIYEFTHADVGGRLLESWGLPESIYRSVLAHHEQDGADCYFDSARVVRFSSEIAAIYHDSQSARKLLNVKHDLAIEYGMSDDESDRLIDMVGAKARDVIALFEVDPGKMKPFSWIVQEANSELGELNLSYEQLLLELQQAKQKSEELGDELKKANEELRNLAYRDDLTGLANRRAFLNRLEAELYRGIRYGRSVAMIMLDVDHFKQVNDTYGHVAGDTVLCSVSRLLTAQLRQCDIVARFGGDEFTMILPETSQEEARLLALRLRNSIEMLRIRHAEHLFSITASIGTAVYEADSEPVTVMQMVERCDKALYLAKHNGRNRVEI